MSNPFDSREASLSGPAHDIQPVLLSDSVNLPTVALALYVQTGGVLSIVTVAGAARSVVAVRRVNQTGTTANGIHAMTLA